MGRKPGTCSLQDLYSNDPFAGDPQKKANNSFIQALLKLYLLVFKDNPQACVAIDGPSAQTTRAVLDANPNALMVAINHDKDAIRVAKECGATGTAGGSEEIITGLCPDFFDVAYMDYMGIHAKRKTEIERASKLLKQHGIMLLTACRRAAKGRTEKADAWNLFPSLELSVIGRHAYKSSLGSNMVVYLLCRRRNLRYVPRKVSRLFKLYVQRHGCISP